MRIVLTSKNADGARTSRISAQVMRPVRPSPPTVARKRSERDSREHSMREPSERTSSNRVTWSPNVPATWWFFPCTSFAIAPPTVTKAVPGTTGRNQPAGTTISSNPASVAPASQRITPAARSNSIRRSIAAVASRVPPSFRQLSP